nr:hypothetical protein Iba_chr13bCG9100 [Ipomoea batatas]
MFLCMIEWNPGVLLRSNFLYLSEALSWIDARMVLGAYVDDLIIFSISCHEKDDSSLVLRQRESGVLDISRELRSEVGFGFLWLCLHFCVLIDAVGLARKTTTKDRNGEEEWVEPGDYGVKWAFGFLWLRLHFCGGRVGLLKKTKHGNGEEVCIEAQKW